MQLPIAVQAALDESERDFTRLMDSLGMSREDLGRLAGRIRRQRPDASRRPTRAADLRGGIHV